MTAFDRAVAVMFDNADLARSAVYTPPATVPPADPAEPIAITVIPSLQDPEAAAMRSRRNLTAFEVLVSELASPVEGATLVVDGVTYRIQSRPAYAEDERLTWRLEAFEVTA